MKLKRVLVICISVIFFTIACSSAKHVEKKPPSRFSGITLSKDIEQKDSLGVPIEPTTSFTSLDKEVVAHLKFENLAGKHLLRWDWIDPDGNLYYSTGDYPVKTSQGKYLIQATAWHRLSIMGDLAAQQDGQWAVKAFVDNELIDSKNFVITSLQDIDKFPEAVQRPYPKDWAIVIGIEEYASLPSVDYARRDALIVKEYFTKMMGVPEENVIMLIDGEATKATLEGYLKQYLPANVDKDTTLYVYYAGHGAPDMEKGEPYLVPHDGNMRFIAQTSYRLKNFYNDLDNLNVGRTYIFMDSCFSGVASRASEMLAKGARPALVHVEGVSIDANNIVAISAATSAQVSNSYPETEHGLFTYYLLKALRGDADENEDDWVSIKETYAYIKKNVTRVARRMGLEQTPVITPSLESLKDQSIIRVMDN